VELGKSQIQAAKDIYNNFSEAASEFGSISGKIIYRFSDCYLDMSPTKKVDDLFREFGTIIKFDYKVNKDLNLVARLSVGDPEKPYRNYYRINEAFQSFFDQFYLKYKSKKNIYYLGRYPINFYSRNSGFVLFSPNIEFEGIGGEFNNSMGKFHCGYARIAEGRNIDFRGETANKEDLIRYGGFNFSINKKTDFRITLFDFNINSLSPFPATHAAGGTRLYAYAKDYRIIDLSLKLKLKKPLFSKYAVTLIGEYLKNIEENNNNTAWSTRIVIGKKCSKKGDLQFILSYSKVEPYSIIGYYSTCGRIVNSKGIFTKFNIGISENMTLTLLTSNLEKENHALPGPHNKFDRKMLMMTYKW
jgi:hypothetical protein